MVKSSHSVRRILGEPFSAFPVGMFAPRRVIATTVALRGEFDYISQSIYINQDIK
jgi:hypothetical protein